MSTQKKFIVLFGAVLMGFVGGISRPAMAVHEEVYLSPKEKVIDALNGLAEKATDGQKGFQEAAEHASSDELKAHFMSQSSEREKFARELRDKAEAMEEKPENEGTLSGAAARMARSQNRRQQK